MKAGFLQFLRKEAVKTEKLMKEKNPENDRCEGLLRSLDAKIKMLKQLEKSGCYGQRGLGAGTLQDSELP